MFLKKGNPKFNEGQYTPNEFQVFFFFNETLSNPHLQRGFMIKDFFRDGEEVLSKT